MEDFEPVLSIITPTYNRGDLLINCYKSLCSQTDKRFEWIIIDDGSDDDTKKIINEIKSNHIGFRIIYHYKSNGGKHTALNASHSFINGQFVLMLDSDDYLVDDAVSIVLSQWDKHHNDRRIGMIIFLKATQDNRICAYVKDEKIPVDYLKYPRQCIVNNDCCEVIRTDLFKKYPFPVFEEEHFLAETALWYRVALECKCIYINKVIYMCEYLDTGLTKSGKSLRIKNPKGGMYTSYLRMHKRCNYKERIKAASLYICYGSFANVSISKLIRDAQPYYMLIISFLLPGKIMYLIWSQKYGKGK